MRWPLALLAVAALAGPTVSTASSPTLRVTDRSPFTVKGAGFAEREHVRVVVSADGNSTSKWVTAGPGGGLSVQLPGVKLGKCPAYVVRAFGAEGSRAAIRFMPECPQPFDR